MTPRANTVPGPHDLVAWIESPDDIAHLYVGRGDDTVLVRSLARTDTLDYGYEGCSVEHISWCDQHVVVVTHERNSQFVTCINPTLGDDSFLALSHACVVERNLLIWADDNPGLLCTASLPTFDARVPIPMRGAHPSGHIHLIPNSAPSSHGLQHCVHAELKQHAGGGTIDMLTLPSDRQRSEYRPVDNLLDLVEQRLYPVGGATVDARFVIEAIAYAFMRGAPQRNRRATWEPSPVWMPVYWMQHLLSKKKNSEALQFLQLLDAICAHVSDDEPEHGWNPEWSNEQAQVELALRYVCRQARTMAQVCRNGAMPAGWWSLLLDPAPKSTVVGSRVDASLYPPTLRSVFEQLAATSKTGTPFLIPSSLPDC